MSDGIPTSIGRYEIVCELGRGMMGVVYEARDPQLGRTVAVKTIQLAFAIMPEQREFEERFFIEGRIAARLCHPGIVVCHDVGKDPETGTPATDDAQPRQSRSVQRRVRNSAASRSGVHMASRAHVRRGSRFSSRVCPLNATISIRRVRLSALSRRIRLVTGYAGHPDIHHDDVR